MFLNFQKIKSLFDANVIQSEENEATAFAKDLAKNSSVSVVLMDRGKELLFVISQSDFVIFELR